MVTCQYRSAFSILLCHLLLLIQTEIKTLTLAWRLSEKGESFDFLPSTPRLVFGVEHCVYTFSVIFIQRQLTGIIYAYRANPAAHSLSVLDTQLSPCHLYSFRDDSYIRVKSKKREKTMQTQDCPHGYPRELCQSRYWSPLGNNLTPMLSQVNLIFGSGSATGDCKMNLPHLCPCAPRRQRTGGPQRYPLFLSLLITSHLGGHHVQTDWKFWYVPTLCNTISCQMAPWKLPELQWKYNWSPLEIK